MQTRLPLSANISLLFHEIPFLDRFKAAAQAGFAVVECQFPYAHTPAILRAALDEAGVRLLSLNTPPGDAEGDFGLACDPARRAAFQAGVHRALAYAAALDVPMVHVLAGHGGAGSQAEAEASYLANMAWAADNAARTGRIILTEPLNTRDRPGYFLQASDQAAMLLRVLARPNLKLLFDVYHIQIMEGDVARRLEQHFGLIGHVQIAAVPSRAEPDEGEVAVVDVCALLQQLGYAGHLGCEYKPRAGTLQGLAWRNLIRLDAA